MKNMQPRGIPTQKLAEFQGNPLSMQGVVFHDLGFIRCS